MRADLAIAPHPAQALTLPLKEACTNRTTECVRHDGYAPMNARLSLDTARRAPSAAEHASVSSSSKRPPYGGGASCSSCPKSADHCSDRTVPGFYEPKWRFNGTAREPRITLCGYDHGAGKPAIFATGGEGDVDQAARLLPNLRTATQYPPSAQPTAKPEERPKAAGRPGGRHHDGERGSTVGQRDRRLQCNWLRRGGRAAPALGKRGSLFKRAPRVIALLRVTIDRNCAVPHCVVSRSATAIFSQHGRPRLRALLWQQQSCRATSDGRERRRSGDATS